jgi:hypothetical protein
MMALVDRKLQRKEAGVRKRRGEAVGEQDAAQAGAQCRHDEDARSAPGTPLEGRRLLAHAHGDRRSRRDKWISTTTTATIKLLTRICMPVLAPTSGSMSVTVAMISAPMTVRPTEPHPSVTALPPTRIA